MVFWIIYSESFDLRVTSELCNPHTHLRKKASGLHNPKTNLDFQII